MKDPKIPDVERKSIPYNQRLVLEEIGPEFNLFIDELGYKALNDVQMKITPML